MDDRNNGLLIEGLVQGSYDRMFGPGKVEARHHPLTSWAQATVSGSESNFQDTHRDLLRTFEAVQSTLYKEGGNDELLTDLSAVENRLTGATTVDELGTAIIESRPVLDRVFGR
ncbi:MULTISPECIES: hypothetical protein [Pseudomonas]|jgi:hypothetical protein|uniref:Uncharacterized protein n=2 Tax=Pseudomonas putida TaxID=303 RepID=A0A1L7NNV3_PSEPU|nr:MULTISPECIES: hypothetical protein [Pseudomonas]PYG98463.1 hypothetical protein CVV67_20725 [Arthrobacter stackebrandtii]HCF2574961.1 hypothetical protein [Pseudomonas aeruginosa]AGN82349.1 hypothetical protein L483_15505 [Pseudomonas putida H8234]ELS0927116.1 hypothetical protein [Pseudomonas putida]ENY74094.1 hypothetical protein C206_28946 [Pseudomonas putida TRO1]